MTALCPDGVVHEFVDGSAWAYDSDFILVQCQDFWCIDGYDNKLYCVSEPAIREWEDDCGCGYLQEGDGYFYFECDSASTAK